MRDIKFRGKSKRCFPQQRWIYGDLLQPTTLLYDNYEISDCNSVDGSRYDIDSETIGQYTGLKDKNGVEIYEGDIINDERDEIGVITWQEDDAKYVVEIDNEIYDLGEIGRYSEVIGNIFDNPELLGE